ncbi:hypothetical protein [Okeania sp. SIO2B3]|uniref:hypothetical protein n=1 Tax=Okeania sp. SIO2B3 TaxID=2607784 RepID=UPI0013BFA8BE|nr:hypothetical protein [Okeania sp. SIO2B3]NET45779.1 hypothetical protein [Okeania sp. SIO2B3]
MSDSEILALRKNSPFSVDSANENFSINIDIGWSMSDFWLWEMMKFLYLSFV